MLRVNLMRATICNQENVSVHRLDWIEALPADERPAVMQEDMIAGRGADAGGPSSLQKGDKFPVIIGSDLIYEVRPEKLNISCLCLHSSSRCIQRKQHKGSGRLGHRSGE